jgi:hypothetical protein
LLSAELGVWENASGNATKLIKAAKSKGFMQSASLGQEQRARSKGRSTGLQHDGTRRQSREHPPSPQGFHL